MKKTPSSGKDDPHGNPDSRAAAGFGRRQFFRNMLVASTAASLGQVGVVPAASRPRQGGGGQGAGGGPNVPAVGAGATENWAEPWVWRPSDWPGQQLHLNVVENENPGRAVGFGNPGSILFSYGGNTPGPTIRMKGDEILFVKLRNMLGEDLGRSPIRESPDTGGLTPGLDMQIQRQGGDTYAVIPAEVKHDTCLGEHTNGLHAAHVTNLHTHGLHVRPGRNPNGTHSDNVILRVLPQADLARREEHATDPDCQFLREPGQISFLRDDEQVGEAEYEFRLGNVQRKKMEREGKPPQPRPAGTFWYHPHAHGATHNQVASGMAGFLIIEGDIDDAVNRFFTNQINPDPEMKTGDYDYRERLMFMQRVLNLSRDPDAPAQQRGLRQANRTPALVNGDSVPAIIRMRPGAIERWRVINGSVDGRGFKRFMVVKGQYTVQTVPNPMPPPQTNLELYEVDEQGRTVGPITLANLESLESRKQDLYQLSIDGIALVAGSGDEVRYAVKDLSEQNAGSQNPLWTPDPEALASLGEDPDDPAVDTLCRLRNVWKSGANVRDCFVRPNEFYMGPANRTDIFFQAPRLGSDSRTDADSNTRYDVYTVLAKAVVVHSDNPNQTAQRRVNGNQPTASTPSPADIVLAYIVVEEEAGQNPIANYDIKSFVRRLSEDLPPVQDYLLPIGDDELVVSSEEAGTRDLPAGSHRTRTITYSGWGSQDAPLLSTYPTDPSADNFTSFIENDQSNNGGRLENLIYARNGVDSDGNPYYVALPPAIRTMAISFDNPGPIDPEPRNLPRKFDPTDPNRARMLEDTAEEWALYNVSDMLWGNTRPERKGPTDPVDQNNDPRDTDYKQPTTQFKEHYVAYPMSRKDGQELFDRNHDFQVVSRAVDHPFHIHQNPFWVTRIEIPDENGDLINTLDEPRWMDTIWIPRHRGRVVFRSRFPDFVGAYVHHCHILLHEDNGMMHVIEATPFVSQSNYAARDGDVDIDLKFPRPTRQDAYRQSSMFLDPDPNTGQNYPGFDVEPPELP